jgi:hypothetical protein
MAPQPRSHSPLTGTLCTQPQGQARSALIERRLSAARKTKITINTLVT